MKRFIFFSKTNWNETPRLRHQIARLLASYGHEIVFFQKPSFFWQNPISVNTDELKLVRTNQLIHHQLRIFDFFSNVNALFECRSISSAIRCFDVTEDDVVVNFNYDYFFLRDIFPNNKLISVINDDFVAQSFLNKGKHAHKALLHTCSISDATLVVSYPLARQVSPVCRPHLFFPWSDAKYVNIDRSNSKAVLLWAHIDGRLDFNLMSYVAERLGDFKFYLVGPVSTSVSQDVEILRKSRDNVEVLGARNLNDLPLNDFFASIIPYKQGVGDIEAVTMSNKSLQLMARGLPLVTYGMPDFYEHIGIKKATNPDEFVNFLISFQKGVDDVQSSIENFVNENGSIQRYQQFMGILNHG